jgi:UDP-N-acetylmuramate dehydrogenase
MAMVARRSKTARPKEKAGPLYALSGSHCRKRWTVHWRGTLCCAGLTATALSTKPPLARYSRAMTPDLIPVRGTLTADKPLDSLTWLRVGGPADWVFQPADAKDLADFLRALDPDIPVFAMGVGSNLIVRDGGVRGVVIRLGRGFNAIEAGEVITAGAAALDAHVARKAADAGRDLTFLRTIPGSIGGAVRMNAGCYGSYVADHLIDICVIDRQGETHIIPATALNLQYRQSDLPEGMVIISARFHAPQADPAVLHARMEAQLAQRDASQPTKDRSAGSTFRNPAGFSSTGQAGDSHALKAWAVIDAAGLRGARLGGAQMSPKHPNFLINAKGATAAELEALGEEVRKRVLQQSGISLQWEIMRVGQAIPKTDLPLLELDDPGAAHKA